MGSDAYKELSIAKLCLVVACQWLTDASTVLHSPGDAVEILVLEEFLLSCVWLVGHCLTRRQGIFHNPLLPTQDSLPSSSRALGGGFDARLQRPCGHVFCWMAPLTELRSLGPFLTISPERCAVLFLYSVFLLTQTVGLPHKQNSLTAFKLVLLMII